MAESRKITEFPGVAHQDIKTGEPVMIEIHSNGYAYVRPVRVSDLPGYNDNAKRMQP